MTNNKIPSDFDIPIWTLSEKDLPQSAIEELKPSDPRGLLYVVVCNAALERVQRIDYKGYKTYVISEKQFEQLKNLL